MDASSPREIYARMREIAARSAAEPADLTPFEERVFSQNGEDGVIAELLRRVGAPARSFTEVGCGTGAEANCVLLADVFGFSGLFVEADAAQHEQLAAKYAHTDAVRTLCELVTPANVNAVVGSGNPDVLSIDRKSVV